MKIEIISKALAWRMLVLTVLFTMGLESADSTQQPTYYPFEQRYLNESQLMQFVAFDDNTMPKKALTYSAIPHKTSYDGIINDNVSFNNISSNNISLNDTSFSNTNPNNASSLWLRWLKTI